MFLSSNGNKLIQILIFHHADIDYFHCPLVFLFPNLDITNFKVFSFVDSAIFNGAQENWLGQCRE